MKSLITNSRSANISDCIERLVCGCKEIKIAVGFLLKSGTKRLVNILKRRKINLRYVTILFGTSFGITEPDALKFLFKQGVNLLQYTGQEIYHPKVYYFKKKDYSEALIGSANLSMGALTDNIEAVIKVRVNRNGRIEKEISDFLKSLEQKSIRVDGEIIKRYESIRAPKAYTERKISRAIKIKQTSVRSAIAKELKRHNIVIDWPRKLIFKNKRFAFTGRFASERPQNKCKEATEKHGGICDPNDHITTDTDVLVVGSRGNPTYLWKDYGLKIDSANGLRKCYGKPLIISEERWKRSV